MLVPETQLKTAYSRLAVTSQSATTAASLVGSLLLSIVGVLGMMMTAIVSYTASLVFQRKIVVDSEPTRKTTQAIPAREGFQILFASRALRALTVSAALTNAGVMLGNTMLPVLVLRDLEIPPAVFAIMGVVASIGAVLGSAVAPLLSTRFGLRRLRICSALIAGPAVLFAVYCRQLPGHEVIWLMLQAFLWNLLVSISSVAGADVLPRVAPRHRLASVGAAQRTITLGIMPISALIGGAVGAYTGTTAMIWVWAGLAVAAALPLLRVSELDQF
ncbi:MFS transporter [Flaviflexus equikiangi]|uniref:MFS transporter n=1 Tax=Flaviflexus equikiangi TaxID=2758573 RepID=UPI0015F35975|nr:MFS transporter [Flaviflexus equikiangi]